MSDAVQVAYQRRKDYKASISTKEREIEELEELVKDLDSFIEFGEALVGGGGKETVKVMAVSRPTPATVSAADDVDPADEWATDEDEDKDPVSRVISQRVG